jgi:hypothetical protein
LRTQLRDLQVKSSSYSKQDQASFTADLGQLLQPGAHVDLAQETFLAMASSTA